MCRPNESICGLKCSTLPSGANDVRAGTQLAHRARECEWLEPSGVCVVEKNEHQERSTRFCGSNSVRRLRSAALSMVVTTVKPFSQTTTKSRTPYSTTVGPLE